MDIAPAIHTQSKSLYHPSFEDEAINRSIFAQYRIPQALPVFLGGRAIGITYWDYKTDSVLFRSITHRQWCGFRGYDDLLYNAIANGRYRRIFFAKDGSGNTSGAFWCDLWPCGAVPASGDYSGTTNTARNFSNTTVGALNFGVNAVSGGMTSHLVNYSISQTAVASTNTTTCILYDRVLSYDGGSITTTLSSMTNTNTAARYISAGQPGLLIMVSNSAATGVTASNITTMHYTSIGGSTGRLVPIVNGEALVVLTSIPAPTATVPSFVVCPGSATLNQSGLAFMPLNGGDSGVTKVEDYTASAINTGTLSVVLVKPLATLSAKGTGTQTQVDLARTMFAMERMYDDGCWNMLFITGNANTSRLSGFLGVAWG